MLMHFSLTKIFFRMMLSSDLSSLICDLDTLIGPRRDKTCLRVSCSKVKYGTFQKVNNKGTDQTGRMRRLVCACVVCKPPKTGFFALRPNYGRIVGIVLTELLTYVEVDMDFYCVIEQLLIKFTIQ